MKNTSKVSLFIIVVGFVFLITYAAIAHGQNESVRSVAGQSGARSITFPVPELGNCANQTECKVYCNDAAHIDACVQFARAHGLMNEEDAKRAQDFKEQLQRGQGPGGCSSPQECATFCSNIENLEACLAFAKTHGVNDRHVAEGEKVRAYLRAGGQMPGGCTSQASCREYCGEFAHARECFEFAKKVGITQKPAGTAGEIGEPDESIADNVPSAERFEKFIELVQRGETPGGCQNEQACKTYCSNQAHFEECVNFSVKAGFIEPQVAEKIRATGGRGPGGCDSSRACQNFCNDPSHQTECLEFAKEHDLISREDLQKTQDGLVRLREGLSQAPPEVAECLKSSVGQTAIADIQVGKLLPGPQLGERVRACFEKFGHRSNPVEVFKNAPPEVLECLREKLGDSLGQVQSGEVAPTPEMADAVRVCFEKINFQSRPVTDGGGAAGQRDAPPADRTINFLRTAPPGVQECLKSKLGDAWIKLQSGEAQMGPEFGDVMRACFEEFRPVSPAQIIRPADSTKKEPKENRHNGFIPPHPVGQVPEAVFASPVATCVKNVLGEEAFRKLQSGNELQGNAEVSAVVKKCTEEFQLNGSEEERQPTIPGQTHTEGGREVPSVTSEGSRFAYPFGVERCVQSLKDAATSESLGEVNLQQAVHTCLERNRPTELFTPNREGNQNPLPPQPLPAVVSPVAPGVSAPL